MSLEVVFWISLFFSSIVLLNVIVFKYMILKAVNQHIKPELHQKNITYINHKWLGFFDQGSYRNEKLQILPGSGNGRSTLTIYIDVLYLKDSEQKQATVKIETFLTKIISTKSKW